MQLKNTLLSFISLSPRNERNAPYVVDTILVGLRESFDVLGRNGVKQEDLCLLTGHGQNRPKQGAHRKGLLADRREGEGLIVPPSK